MFNITYKVEFPTRFTSHSEKEIDNFITNIEYYSSSVVGLITLMSDHDAQHFQIFGICNKVNNVTKRFTSRFTKNNFQIF